MPDGQTIAALLLVLGPLLGAIPVGNPRLVRIWSMSRDDHVATVGANRRGWQLLNAGFVLATVATSAGLGILALEADGGTGVRAGLLAGATAYGFGGAALVRRAGGACAHDAGHRRPGRRGRGRHARRVAPRAPRWAACSRGSCSSPPPRSS